MKRYNQPKAGTNDKVVRKEIDYSKINFKSKMANLMEYYQELYKGEIHAEK